MAKGLEGNSESSKYDAHKVAFMALKMIETCSKHVTHDNKNIQVNFGFKFLF